MSEDMNLSVDGHSRVPPGFRFHPTEEELLHYYLRKKVAYQKIDLDVIPDVDLNKLEPWDIQEKCKIGSTPQNDWYFFSHKDKKYPTGTRTNRATAAGFWKATGRDKVICSSLKRIGMRKTLVFYKGRAPHGQKSDWIMHEYRLDDNTTNHHETTTDSTSLVVGEYLTSAEDGWVVCRVFKKKNYHRALESPQNSSTMDSRRSHMYLTSSAKDEGVLDQILLYMGKSCKQEDHETVVVSNNNNSVTSMQSRNPINNTLAAMITSTYTSADELVHGRFVHLPRLERSTSPTIPSLLRPINHDQDCPTFKSLGPSIDKEVFSGTQANMVDDGLINDWAALDRLVASQLNGQSETSKQLSSCCFADHPDHDDGDFCFSSFDHHDLGQLANPRCSRLNQASQVYNSEIELWSFVRPSSSDPLCHLSV